MLKNLNSIISNQHFLKIINYALKFDKWAIAISGGGDSLALFYIILDFLNTSLKAPEVFLLIVNHHLRIESDEEVKFVQNIAKYHQVQFCELHWRHNNNFISGNKHNLAREARYKLITDFCHLNKIPIIFTGHHLNDQVETFFMRLSRGAGIEGLSSIKPIQNFDNIAALRPLLEIPKEIIKSYMSENNLLWVEDRANYNEAYERTRVRKNLDIGFNKNIVTLITTKMLNAQDALNYYVKQELHNCVIKENENFKIKKLHFIKLPIEISLRLLKLIFYDKKSCRILYKDLLLLYNGIISLSCCSSSLQYGNFLISFENDCFLFKKDQIKK